MQTHRLFFTTLVLLLTILSSNSPAGAPIASTVLLRVQDACACAPNLDEFYRKKKTALELYEAAAQQTLHSTDDLRQFLDDAIGGTEEGVEIKGPIVKAIGAYEANRLRKITDVVATLSRKRRWLKQMKRAGVAVEAAEWGALAITAEQLIVLNQLRLDAYRRLEDGKKMVGAANALYDEAVAALDKALRESADCEKARLQRMQPAQSLADRAHQLMESWPNNQVLYKDPSGQILDAGAAFKRASEILSGKTGQRSSHGFVLIPAAMVVHDKVPVQVTIQQLTAAIGEINDRGVRLFKGGMRLLTGWGRVDDAIRAHIAELQRDIAGLDKKMKAAEARCRCGPTTPAPYRPGQTGGGKCR